MTQDREGRREGAAETPSRAIEGSPGARTLTQRIARAANAPVAAGPASSSLADTPAGAAIAPADDPYGFHLLGGPNADGQQAKEVPHRGEMEQLFGQSFGGVSASTGDASLGAQGVRGRAHGESIAFADAAPARDVVAHELTHVVQQRQAGSATTALLTESRPDDAAEVEAREIADQVRGGISVPVRVRAAPSAGVHFEREGDATGARATLPAGTDLPAGVNYEHVSGTMKVRVRSSWLAGADPTATNLELLQHLHDRGALAWATPAQLAAAARATRLTPEDKAAEVTTVTFSASIYAFVGLPPDLQASVSGWGDDLTIAIAAPDIDVEPGTKVPLSAAQVTTLIRTVEDFTRLVVRPETRDRLSEVDFTGRGGPGVFVIRLVRAELDTLFGREAYQGWLDERRGTSGGPDARAVGTAASGLDAEELARVKVWLAAHLPRGTEGGALIDHMLLDVIVEIDASPYRCQILAALTAGRGDGAINARSLRSLVNAVTFEAQAAAAQVPLPGHDGVLPPVWRTPVPARIDQLGGRIVSGERVPFRLAIAVPTELLTPERQAELRLRPFTTSVAWVFEKVDGDSAGTHRQGLLETALGQTHGARTTLHHHYTGEDDEPVSMSFILAPHERAATWRATAYVRHSHFEPAIISTDLQVRDEEDLLLELEQRATEGMGETVSTPKNFDTGFLNNRWGADGTDMGMASYGQVPDDWRARTPPERDAQRGRQMEDLRSMIGYLRDHDSGGGNQAAIRAAQQYLERLQRADRAIERDEADGWQPFEIRGTFLSRTPGVADGSLALFGMAMRVTRRERPRAYVRDAVGTENEGREVEKVRIQLRDLTRRFDADDRRLTGEAATFEAALEEAFVALCKSYPAGRVSVLAQVHGGHGLHATRQTIGFELDSGTVGKDLKAAIFDPLANVAVNLAGMAAMIFVPGSASLVMPALIAYNAAQTVDQLHTEWIEGTLTAKDLTLGLTSIGLDVLPYLGRARAVAGSRRALVVLEGVDLAGEAVYMTAAALDQAQQLQAQQVGAMAGLYKQLVDLQASTHASDPRLLAIQAEFEQRAERVRGATVEAFAGMVKQRAVFLGAKHVFHGLQQAGAPALPAPHALGTLGDVTPAASPHATGDVGTQSAGSAPGARDTSTPDRTTRPPATAPGDAAGARRDRGGLDDAPLRLAGVDEIVAGGLWRGSSAQIATAIHQARATGVAVRVVEVGNRQQPWRIRFGDRTLEIEERAPRPAPQDGAGQRRSDGVPAEVRARLHAQAAAELATMRVTVAPTPGASRGSYYVTQADGRRMAELFPDIEGAEAVAFKAGILVRHGGREWYFEFSDQAHTLGHATRGQAIAPEAGGIGLPAPNVSTVELWGFRGVREIQKPGETRARGSKEWTPEEEATVAKETARDALLEFGHVGISFDGGGTVYALTPKPTADDFAAARARFNDPALSDLEVVKRALKEGSVFPGRVADDGERFRRAQEMADERGWNTAPTRAMILFDPEVGPRLRQRADEQRDLPPGHPDIGRYGFPSRDGDAGVCDDVNNCATYPRRLGVPTPEPTGNLRRYMPDLEKWAAADAPVDARTVEASP